MRLETDVIGLTVLILLLLAYVLFGCAFLFRKKPPQTEEARRAPASTLGIVLQSSRGFRPASDGGLSLLRARSPGDDAKHE